MEEEKKNTHKKNTKKTQKHKNMGIPLVWTKQKEEHYQGIGLAYGQSGVSRDQTPHNAHKLPGKKLLLANIQSRESLRRISKFEVLLKQT